jgi:glycosyltransferase involved in cell wall biosynthesis
MSSAAPFYFARECARRGLSVSMFGAECDAELSASVERVAIGRSWSSLPARLGHLRRAVARFRPDVIHVFWHPGCELYPILVQERPRPVWIADGRSPVVHLGPKGLACSTIARLAPLAYDRLASPSPAVGRVLFGKHNVAVLPLGYDAAHFPPSPRPNGSQKGRLRFVYAGTLNRRRGIGEALAVLAASVDRATLTFSARPAIDVYGRGDGEDQIAAIASSAPDTVRFLGRVSRVELARRMRDYDVGLALVPGRQFREAPALKTLECLASGLPVIANDIPGNRLYVQPGRNGWIVGDDPRELVETVLELCRSGVPESFRRAAAESVRGHSWSDIVERHLLPLYSDCLGAAARP